MSLKFVKDVIIQPCVLSDHDYVILSFNISSDRPNRGPGYWKLNVSILDKLETQNEIEFLWHQELKNINVPDSDWWESCKTKFKEKLIFLSRKYQREHNLEKAPLKEEILQYRKIQMASFKPELFKSIITEKEHKYSELIEQDMRGAIIRSRVQDIEEGEKPSKYFLSKEIVRATKKKIKFLEINGNKITHQNGILEAVCEFYK